MAAIKMFKEFILSSLLLFCVSVIASPTINETPDNYLGKTIQGNDILLENYRGKVVVVSFWASWCAPCLQELPVLDAIQQQTGTDIMQVVAVNFKEDRKRYRKLQKVLSETATRLIFTHDEKGRIGKQYGVEGLPNLFVIGKDGKLVYHNVGYGESTPALLVDILNEALAK